MNLIDIVTRPDLYLKEASKNIVPVTVSVGGLTFRSLLIPAGSSLRIGNILDLNELRSLPRDIGWFITRAPDSRLDFPLELSVELVTRDGKRLVLASQKFSTSCMNSATTTTGIRERFVGADCKPQLETDTGRGRHESWRPLHLNWPTSAREDEIDEMAIECRCPDPDGKVVIGVSEAVELRSPLRKYAKGYGIEVGPGHQPQIQNSPDVTVRYVEQVDFEQWIRRHPAKSETQTDEWKKRMIRLWQNYIVADAQQLEVIQDGTLDFIFSSHVFEHFVNPLGTLQSWRRKLRRGGRVIGFVPDAHNCFDLRQPLSSEQDWWHEFAESGWNYGERHFEKWCRYTEPRTTPASLRARNYSIHAHFYTPESFARLLQIAVKHFEFRSYHIRAVRNNKDFGWILNT